ncbi:DUF1801 domain-containing protein [Mucilaginibacter sp. UYCu711]|uniref:DUF1801 domain-containing protein n=1 Tax=Mucilaginibacter sp. UYCu711 TaxID=3156339 RepID=UPI003D1C1429
MSITAYFNNLPDDRKAPMQALWEAIEDNIPEGFAEQFYYGMPGFVIPHSVYPAGYHGDPKLPLGFIYIGSQKNFIVMHHLGLYANKELLDWFTAEYPKHSKFKLDMGKGCVRFKKPDQIPLALIGQLAARVTPKQYIEIYERVIKR